MKMSRKLILLFSLLAILTTAANSIYFYQASMENLTSRTYETLSALGKRMKIEIEQSFGLMEHALNTLTSNVDFMNALKIAGRQENDGDIGELVAVQTLMSRMLYQTPLLSDFYRVSVYAQNGFFLSNHMEQLNSVISMSDEARETIASLSYLSQLDHEPYKRLVIPIHDDPWTTTGSRSVFTMVQCVVWHGQKIGYIEISAVAENLAEIFWLHEIDGLLVQAVFDEGEPLFLFSGDDVVYSDISSVGLTTYRLADGSERLVTKVHSPKLNLNIFLSQDKTAYSLQARALLIRYAAVAGIVLLVTFALIISISMGLTRSIRRLTKKMKNLPVDSFMAYPKRTTLTLVTKPQDTDFYQMEKVFNDMLMRLQRSHSQEISLREGTLHAQLRALQTQINPHFVYNTLNIISAKGMECGNEEIIAICDQFARMLRYATDVRSQTATLGEELQNARHYLLLSKARYEDQLLFTIDVDESIQSLLLPKLSIQPIVENSLAHGFTNWTGRREIDIMGTVSKDHLTLVIRDNGSGFDEKVLKDLTASFAQVEQNHSFTSFFPTGDIGLANTYLRLFYYSKGKIRMRLYNQNGAVVELTMPLEEERHV